MKLVCYRLLFTRYECTITVIKFRKNIDVSSREDIIVESSQILKSILLSFLAAFTFYDLKYKKIPAWLLLFMAITGIFYVIMMGDCRNISRYMGASTGLLFFVFSFLTHEAIGKGDALLFVILGWYLGVYQLILVLFVAFTFSSIFSVVLLFMKKGNYKTSFPFVPFLYIAFGGICLL